MGPNLLVLGGTTEARKLCALLHAQGVAATVSLAGRVADPLALDLPVRVGGFGGVAGLVAYLSAQGITHVVDATHPFAAQMSVNAHAACARLGLPLIALTRAAWQAQPGDCWQHVADMAGAVAALDQPRRRVMLAVGRMHLADFRPHPQHFYLLRLVDAPDTPPGFPDHHAVIARGPFKIDDDLALMRAHGIEIVVSKNSGGAGAYAKIAAARHLGLPVIMIDRPALPKREQVHAPEDILRWLNHGLAHGATDLGV